MVQEQIRSSGTNATAAIAAIGGNTGSAKLLELQQQKNLMVKQQHLI